MRNRDWEKRNPEKVKAMRERDYALHAEAYKRRAKARYQMIKSEMKEMKKVRKKQKDD